MCNIENVTINQMLFSLTDVNSLKLVRCSQKKSNFKTGNYKNTKIRSKSSWNLFNTEEFLEIDLNSKKSVHKCSVYRAEQLNGHHRLHFYGYHVFAICAHRYAPQKSRIGIRITWNIINQVCALCRVRIRKGFLQTRRKIFSFCEKFSRKKKLQIPSSNPSGPANQIISRHDVSISTAAVSIFSSTSYVLK